MSHDVWCSTYFAILSHQLCLEFIVIFLLTINLVTEPLRCTVLRYINILNLKTKQGVKHIVYIFITQETTKLDNLKG